MKKWVVVNSYLISLSSCVYTLFLKYEIKMHERESGEKVEMKMQFLGVDRAKTDILWVL